MSNLEEVVNQLNIKLSKLNTRIFELDLLGNNNLIQDSDIILLQKNVATLLLNVATLTSRLDTKEGDVNALTKSLGGLSGDISKLNQSIDGTFFDINQQLSGIVNDTQASADKITTLETTLADTNHIIEGHSILVNDLSSSVTNTEAGIVANASKHSLLESIVGSNTSKIDTEIKTTANDRLANTSKFAHYDSTISGLNGFSAANAKSIASLDLKTETTKNGLAAEVARVDGLKGTVGANSGAIADSAALKITEDLALATRLTNIETKVGNNASNYASQITIRSDAENAIAQSVTTLSTTVDTHTKSINQILTSGGGTGVDGSYSLTIDSAGRISGFGLTQINPLTYTPTGLPTDPAVGQGISKFWVRADTFAIINPTYDTVHPAFKVSGGNVFINNVLIEDASITNAKIGNVIQSTLWEPIYKQGWHLNKDGSAFFNNITITNTAGNTIMSSGTGVEWSYLANKPLDSTILNSNVTLTSLGYTGDLNATNGAIWSAVTDDGGKPANGADVTSANTALNTVNVGSLSAADVSTATTNFNNRNDRSILAVVDPIVATDGTAVNHISNTDGSVDVTFEWSWLGTNSDIDGFVVYSRNSITNEVYVFGTTPSEESLIYLPADRRAFGFLGISANNYYTFGVQAYRRVDPDISLNGLISSQIIIAAGVNENPYQPSTSVTFAGDITGTIQGTNIGALATANSVDFITQVSGTGKPEVNATAGATFGTNISGQITPANASTYIANAAIQNAQIGVAAVDTLSVKGGAIVAEVVSTQTDAPQVYIVTVSIPAGIFRGEAYLRPYYRTISSAALTLDAATFTGTSSLPVLGTWFAGQARETYYWDGANAYIYFYSGLGHVYRILRNGVTIEEPIGNRVLPGWGDGLASQTISFSDTLTSAGTYLYEFQVVGYTDNTNYGTNYTPLGIWQSPTVPTNGTNGTNIPRTLTLRVGKR